MNTDPKKDELFEILRILNKKNVSQRKLAKELSMSLGKVNYCLKALQKKGLIKLKNFRNNKNKIQYLYLLTPKGISEKTKLTINFLKKRAEEYNKLKQEMKSDG